MNLQEFFNTDFVDYASYDNLRKIASCIDGQKNASRKVLYTVLEKNIKDKIKVSQLGSKVAEFSEYLHGNMDGVIVNLAQDFAGTNNIPLLQKKGNFGTRFANEASASRYIFTYGSDVFFKLFNKDDNNILKSQTFEGEKIEPMFYLPSLPLLLINGSEGVSSGFAQKILPRSFKNIKQYVEDVLNNKKLNKTLLIPSFNGFNGTIIQGETNKQWIIKGQIKRINQTTLVIDEIPIGYDLKSYIKVLDTLEESKIINAYKDLSDNDIFKFEVKMTTKDLNSLSEDELLQKLKLVKTVTENYTCLDENNKIIEFESADDIISYYIDVKYKFLCLRKDYLLRSLKKKLSILSSKITFIKKIIDGELVIQKRSKSDIEKDLLQIDEIIKVNDSYDYLLNMSLYTLTKERLQKLSEEFKTCKCDIKELCDLTFNEMWMNDLKML